MRPLIALPSRLTDTADTWRVPATALGQPYQQALIRAGGLPVAVPPLFAGDDLDDTADDVMSRVDALCLPGGPDVEPAQYGATEPHPRLMMVRLEHDALDLALARAAIHQDKPVLAICRGHQVLNVALGGTLHQHLPDLIGKRAADDHFRHHNDIDVVAGSKAAAAMGTTRPRGHCVHHQAVDELGAGLVVTAWAGDVIEGVELPDRWVVGVQWHPEDTAATDPAQQALFDGFVAATRQSVPSA
ncbi:MAG: gamma-glutamyl-gamma-aminobutyrate hydrolase family protein [Acidimicrobiales bacterium]